MSENPKIYPSASDPAEPVTPVVYEQETSVLEYKHLERDLHQTEPLTEEELNKFGMESWELVTAFTHGHSVHYYFKQVKPAG
jgi:hypothetical protein